MPERYIRLCLACGAQWDPAMLHVNPDWEHSPDDHCPWCGADLQEAVDKAIKGSAGGTFYVGAGDADDGGEDD
jgi:hypothetical protein